MKKINRSRRSFLSTSLKAGIALPFAGAALTSCMSSAKEESGSIKPLNILILGGTSFLGPHQIKYALERGHKVSTFTRGKTIPKINAEVFEQVEPLIGDRVDNLTALENRKWDVVIDNSGRNPEWTEATAKLLKDSCELYLYVSSTGVFFPYVNSEFKEDSKVLLELPAEIDEVEKPSYDFGIMKANSEIAAKTNFGEGRTIVVRPTYMYGPGDRTDRFVHYPVRLPKGGETLVLGRRDDQVQYIDIRDSAEWMIRLAESKTVGTHHAVGPASFQGLAEFMTEAQKAFDVEASFVYADDYDWLKENGLYYALPWIMADGNDLGGLKINNSKSLQNGISFRPLTQTIKDTHDWWLSDAVDEERRTKYHASERSLLAREAELLEKWKNYQAAK